MTYLHEIVEMLHRATPEEKKWILDSLPDDKEADAIRALFTQTWQRVSATLISVFRGVKEQ